MICHLLCDMSINAIFHAIEIVCLFLLAGPINAFCSGYHAMTIKYFNRNFPAIENNKNG